MATTSPPESSDARRIPGPALPSGEDRFVAALTKAVQRFRAYPPDNPLCVEAIDACHRALGAAGLDQLTIRIGPRALLLDDDPLAETPAIGDLRRRLHQIGLGALTVSREATARELTWFCREIASHEGRTDAETMPERLAEHGVQHIHVAIVVRPAVLGAEGVPAERLAEVDTEERQRAAERGVRGGSHLYPRDKGWIRLDPGLPPPAHLSLTGLARLVDDPLALSVMLVTLSDQPPFDDPAEALADKFATVSAILKSMEPAQSQTSFARLARFVLDLPEKRREQFFRHTVLPALVEGRVDGSMLRHFPDASLAELMAVHLEDRHTEREWLMLALDRLELPPERRANVEALLGQGAAERRAGDGDALRRPGPGRVDLDRIAVDASTPKEFHDFTAFDLAIDTAAEATLADLKTSIATTQPATERLRCLINLLALEANPDRARRLAGAVSPLLDGVRSAGDQRHLAAWIQRLREVADVLRGERSEIAALLDGLLARQIDERLLETLLGLKSLEPGAAGGPLQMLESLGAAAAPALVDLLEHETVRSRRHALVKMMSACAPALAPGILALFPHSNKFVTRNLATVLGHAGTGHEDALAPVVTHADVRVGREALRALAQIGSARALEIVRGALTEREDVAAAAEDVFWSFAGARQAALERLADAGFVSSHPALARRLLEHAATQFDSDLERVAAALEPLRFHLWRPALVALGLAAARVRAR